MQNRLLRACAGIAVLASAAMMFGPGVAPASADAGVSLTTVRLHATAKNCWTVVGQGVFNVTLWISRHPGGAAPIQAMCGNDATAAFKSQHGVIGPEANRLAMYRIGTLIASPVTVVPVKPAVVAKPTVAPKVVIGSYSATQVAAQNSLSSCWTVVNGSVYNLTSWVNKHPGGRTAISALCGRDSSAAFSAKHGASSTAVNTLKSLRLGAFDKSGSVALATTPVLNFGSEEDD